MYRPMNAMAGKSISIIGRFHMSVRNTSPGWPMNVAVPIIVPTSDSPTTQPGMLRPPRKYWSVDVCRRAKYKPTRITSPR